jgi:hypothetical protein
MIYTNDIFDILYTLYYIYIYIDIMIYTNNIFNTLYFLYINIISAYEI